MMIRRNGTRWAVSAVLALAALGVGLSAVGPLAGQQPADQPPRPPGGQPSGVERAREMAELIKQGQLTLPDAATIAEKHVKGVALETRCDIQPETATLAEPTPQQPQRPRGPSTENQPDGGGKHLVYQVSCFANDVIQSVRVDGLTRKVIDVREGDLSGGGAAPP